MEKDQNNQQHNREMLKDFCVKFFIAISGNNIKDETDETMIKLGEDVKTDYGEDVFKTLIAEIYPVARDPLQLAALCLNNYLIGDTTPVDPKDHPALAQNIENLLNKHNL